MSIHWEKHTLGEICELITDGTHSSPQSKEGPYRYVTSKNIRFGSIDLTDCEYISEAEHKAIYRGCPVQFGDVLLTKDGANAGNVAINPLTEQFSLLSSVAVIRAKGDRATNQFIFQYLFSPFGQAQIDDHIAGQAITRLTLDKIRNLNIPLPPLAEQRKIAAILSTWDEAIALTGQLIAALKRRKQALMQLLLTGKVRFKEFEGEAWEEVELGEIAEVRGGKRLPKGRELVDVHTGHPYVRVSDMHEYGVVLDKIAYVPLDIAPLIKAYRIYCDELYISVAGTIGLVGKIPPELDGANLTENADRITNIAANNDYLLQVLRSEIVQEQIAQSMTSNAQPKLALERIRRFLCMSSKQNGQTR